MTNGHGRYITATPERTLFSVGKFPLNVWPLNFWPFQFRNRRVTAVSLLKPPSGSRSGFKNPQVLLGPITAKKPTYPQNRAWNHLFPHSVLESRSKKAGLGSSSKPKHFSQILKQKRGSQPFGHLKWPGVGPNELICGSGGPLKAAFWPITFPRVRFHCQLFCPYIFC